MRGIHNTLKRVRAEGTENHLDIFSKWCWKKEVLCFSSPLMSIVDQLQSHTGDISISFSSFCPIPLHSHSWSRHYDWEEKHFPGPPLAVTSGPWTGPFESPSPMIFIRVSPQNVPISRKPRFPHPRATCVWLTGEKSTGELDLLFIKQVFIKTCYL